MSKITQIAITWTATKLFTNKSVYLATVMYPLGITNDIDSPSLTLPAISTDPNFKNYSNCCHLDNSPKVYPSWYIVYMFNPIYS